MQLSWRPCLTFCLKSKTSLIDASTIFFRRLQLITAQSQLGEVTARSRRGHSSVTARSQLNHGEVTAQSRPRSWLVTAGCDHFGHRELTVAIFFLMGWHAWNLLWSDDQENNYAKMKFSSHLKCGWKPFVKWAQFIKVIKSEESRPN